MASPKKSQLRIFVDSSVFFAAAFSASGPARAVVNEATRGACELVISSLVVEETTRNLARHAPAAVALFRQLIQLPCVQMIADPSKRQVERVAAIVNLKDAPIVAAAMRARVAYLASHDRELLKQSEVIELNFGLPVVRPGDVLHLLRAR
jgi:predicted nucleic acid-binding protein